MARKDSSRDKMPGSDPERAESAPPTSSHYTDVARIHSLFPSASPFDFRPKIHPHGDSIHFDVSSARQVIGSALVYIYRWRCRTRATFAAESNPRTEGEGMVIRSSFRGENSHRIAGRRGRNEFIITSRSGARWKSPAGRVEEDKFIKGRKKWWWSKGRRGLESRVSVERVSRAHSPHARREADKTYAD